jgi:predicted CoA-binding protein
MADDEIGEILAGASTLAIVGLSPNPERDSHRVARYLQGVGYRIVPVNPTVDTVLGERSYPSLDSVPDPIDLVVVFRRSEDVAPVAEAALRKSVRAFWMQLGIRDPASADRLRRAGIRVVEDRCTMVEHRARFGGEASQER